MPQLDSQPPLTLYAMGTDAEWDDLKSGLALGQGLHSVTRNVIDYARLDLGATLLIVENGYVCKDYRDEYSYLYSRFFQRIGSRCDRIHFLSGDVASIDDLAEMDNSCYLGFAVVRPLPVQRIGRTVLALPDAPTAHDLHYPLCNTDFEVHLGPASFSVKGVPFIQQDGMVLVCAHAAIWTAARYMHQKYHSGEFLPSQINSMVATAGSHPTATRDYPSEGVGFDQMIHVLKVMGFSPLALAGEPYTAIPRLDVYSSVYAYLESRLPVVLGTNDHALTAVGHTFNPDPGLVDAQVAKAVHDGERLVLFSDAWADGLIVQDDAEGPYRVLPRTAADRPRFVADPARSHQLSHLGSFEESVVFMIAPLPYSVFLVDSHVRTLVRNYLLARAQSGQAPQEITDAIEPNNGDPLVVRMYLAPSVDYKEALGVQLAGGDCISAELVKIYKLLPMPQYVWVCEVTKRSLFCHPQESDRRILGEMIVDAKGHKFGGNRYVAVHLLDSLSLLDADAGKYDVRTVAYDGPYRHHTRDH